MFDMNRIRHINVKLACTTMKSPVGLLRLVASEEELLAVIFEKSKAQEQKGLRAIEESRGHPLLGHVEKQLRQYFSGRLKSFDIPLGLYGTPFQVAVWNELLKIPYGRTCSYGDLASRIGDAKKARPVGGAVGSNPIGIIVPCHRVIGKDGSLTGFGGGLDVKTYLLNLETRWA